LAREPRAFLKGLLWLPGAAIALAGCRLWETERYTRLTFPPGMRQTRVLMIGDSLTYYNDLPGLLQQMSALEQAPIYIEKITAPYRSLEAHWAAGAAAERVRQGHWDYVILQEFSRKPVTDPIGSRASIRKFAEAAARAGAKTILFENWTRAGHDDDYEAMQRTYRTAAEENGATLAPIGPAWNAARAQRPDIQLLLDDRHPTDAGTYLAAAVLYDTIYHKKSSALPASLLGPKLSADETKALRAFADQVAP
jgi:hypothetical protein